MLHLHPTCQYFAFAQSLGHIFCVNVGFVICNSATKKTVDIAQYTIHVSYVYPIQVRYRIWSWAGVESTCMRDGRANGFAATLKRIPQTRRGMGPAYPWSAGFSNSIVYEGEGRFVGIVSWLKLGNRFWDEEMRKIRWLAYLFFLGVGGVYFFGGKGFEKAHVCKSQQNL